MPAFAPLDVGIKACAAIPGYFYFHFICMCVREAETEKRERERVTKRYIVPNVKVPVKAGRGHQIGWSWSYRGLRTA